MRKTIRLCVTLLFILVTLCGCSAMQKPIVRHDITRDELDVFYYGITPEKVEQAFGLPHLYRSNTKETLYYYDVENGYLGKH